jgi:hypothetical protein
MTTQTTLESLSIAGIAIRQDDEGRFCLNDLHRASGGESKHQPAFWLRNAQTQDLVNEISIAGIPTIQSKQGLRDTLQICRDTQTTGIPLVTLEGKNGGAYVCKETL